jgi:hypothetical protein
MEYLNSKISRFDAHQGLYHGKIINTEINDMELIGVGELIIEDVKWYSYSTSTPLLFMRSDYGYTWDGEIKLKNVDAYIHRDQRSGLIIVSHSFVNWYFGYTCAIPSVTLDNLDVYYVDTMTPVEAGHEITLVNVTNSRMHLDGANVGAAVILPYKDSDEDGYIDEPLFDINRDGVIGEADDVDLDKNGDKFNTYIEYISEGDYVAANGTQDEYRNGIYLSGCTTNVNLTKPPEYVKIINNDGVNGAGGYKYVMWDTSGNNISDGKFYSDTDSFGGFFGGTKFIYGTGDEDFFYGTENKNGITNTFIFK